MPTEARSARRSTGLVPAGEDRILTGTIKPCLFFRRGCRAMLWLCLLVGPGWSLAATELTAEERAAATQLGGLVEQSGFRSKKITDTVWAVYEKSASGAEWQVLCVSGEGYFVIGIVVAEKAKMQLTEEALRRLLKLSQTMTT
ncbi:MAG: hypothetical protein EXS42_04610 [Lacunisphaera sp.]|nr:hypothetical protein [Lacunisphaera sp.]